MAGLVWLNGHQAAQLHHFLHMAGQTAIFLGIAMVIQFGPLLFWKPDPTPRPVNPDLQERPPSRSILRPAVSALILASIFRSKAT